MVEYDLKQVVVWRKDLKVRTGKIAAQAAHASLKVIFDHFGTKTNEGMLIEFKGMDQWFCGPFAKIVLGCKDLEELEALAKHARLAGLPVSVIVDAGNTEFGGVPTTTCLAIGPARKDQIDLVTGHLSLM